MAKEVPFKPGESLKYSAEFNLIPVGQAELYVSGIEQIHGKDAYHVSFSAQTKGLANQLFKIRDQIDIWMDSEKFFTHRLKKNIQIIGQSNSGLNIYIFKYKNPNKHGFGLFQGVMSDEVLPEATYVNSDGFDIVDYNKIDVEFKQVII